MTALGAAVRPLWGIDPEVAFLNHGSFGACPTPVLAVQAELRAVLEAEPVDFFVRDYAGRLDLARRAVAGFLGADPAGLAFVPNATTGVAVVLHSLGLGRGDRVVVTDHVYGAVLQALLVRDVDLVVVPVDLDDEDPAGTLLAAVDDRTRLVVVDAVTSCTAWVLPVERVVRGCRAAGVACLVDAAHAPGQLPVDLTALDPDYWVGNLHKWGYAPKGAAVLQVRADLRAGVRPVVVSHHTGYPAALDWTGTTDVTSYLAAPAALDLLGGWGWERVRAHGHELAWAGAELLRDRLGARLPFDDRRDRHALMVLVDLGLDSLGAAEAVREQLRARGVEVAATSWRGRGYLRLSGAVYNDLDDVERLVAALS